MSGTREGIISVKSPSSSVTAAPYWRFPDAARAETETLAIGWSAVSTSRPWTVTRRTTSIGGSSNASTPAGTRCRFRRGSSPTCTKRESGVDTNCIVTSPGRVLTSKRPWELLTARLPSFGALRLDEDLGPCDRVTGPAGADRPREQFSRRTSTAVIASPSTSTSGTRGSSGAVHRDPELRVSRGDRGDQKEAVGPENLCVPLSRRSRSPVVVMEILTPRVHSQHRRQCAEDASCGPEMNLTRWTTRGRFLEPQVLNARGRGPICTERKAAYGKAEPGAAVAGDRLQDAQNIPGARCRSG